MEMEEETEIKQRDEIENLKKKSNTLLNQMLMQRSRGDSLNKRSEINASKNRHNKTVSAMGGNGIFESSEIIGWGDNNANILDYGNRTFILGERKSEIPIQIHKFRKRKYTHKSENSMTHLKQTFRKEPRVEDFLRKVPVILHKEENGIIKFKNQSNRKQEEKTIEIKRFDDLNNLINDYYGINNIRYRKREGSVNSFQENKGKDHQFFPFEIKMKGLISNDPLNISQ